MRLYVDVYVQHTHQHRGIEVRVYVDVYVQHIHQHGHGLIVSELQPGGWENNDNLRELPVATANPGDARVKVGSERQAASSPNSPRIALDEIGYTTIWNLSAGTLQNWPCYREDYSHKIPYTTVGFSVEIVLLLAK